MGRPWGKARVGPQNHDADREACGNGGGWEAYLQVLWEHFCHVPLENQALASPLDIYTLTPAHAGNFHPLLLSADQTAHKSISLYVVWDLKM